MGEATEPLIGNALDCRMDRTAENLLALSKRIGALEQALAAEQAARAAAERERDEARQWVRDLHSGMYINCVYCGHRYGPRGEVPESMADVLKAHIEKCPKHPLADAERRLGVAREALREYGRHGPKCPITQYGDHMTCCCGLSQALDALGPAPTPTH